MAACTLILAGLPARSAAQPAAGGAVVIDGSPRPVPPETITRDALRRPTVRAIKLTEPLRVDGQLDEAIYSTVPPFGGFIQVVPETGAEASERTDVWISFDDSHIYVSARVWDSAPPEQWVANELRRDTNQLRNNDHLGVMFDTFYDRRSGFMFYSNPLGALADYSVIDEGQSNTDWNPVWEVRTGRFEGGWTIEMAIPFKTLRYRSGTNQTWGIQMRRSIRRKNEWAYLSPAPASMAGPQALNRISAAGTLVGLDLPAASKNFELKPYVIGRSETDRARVPSLSNDLNAAFGGDVKYGVTANLTADFTFNTDFAQVEIDEQQVNLTRFSLFFPEKRDFFLEGRGVFDFGRGGTGAGGPGGGTSDTPYLFYSRRIGLNAGRVVPIDAGGRLTGKVGNFGVGVMNIQAGDEELSGTPSTNFTVLRVKRDILRRSTVGAMFTNRSVSATGGGANQAYGVDGSFSFYQNVTASAYWARTESEGLDGDNESYQARMNYNADRYGAQAEYLKVGDAFNPEVGFLRRDDFTRSYAQLRFSPRPARLRAVRKFSVQADVEYFENGAGDVETRIQSGRFNTEFENSDQFTINVDHTYEGLFRPFAVRPGVVIAPGGYTFTDARVSYQLGAQRRLSGTFALQQGGFYDGTITVASYSGGRVSVSQRFSLEPSVSLNKVDLPAGEFTTTLVRSRIDYGFSPRMFASALLQYNSSDRLFSSNVRFRWEYRAGSEVFLVWTDEHDTLRRVQGGGSLRNRAFVAKVTRLLRF
ncbi:MAG: DUF5916 domain-containing protein [Vicinamibacterales bacterium]|nr:DUF5916 domain-containing protein [Vicinamibacterales bacterium]